MMYNPYHTYTHTHTHTHPHHSTQDMDETTARYILRLPGVRERINDKTKATTSKWRSRFKLTRLLVRLGSKKALFKALSAWEGQTPLGSAARNNNTAVANALIREGADPRLRNSQGHTALDQARIVNGAGYYNPLLIAGDDTRSLLRLRGAAPTLFNENSSSRPGGDAPPLDTPSYPLYVMTVATLLRLEKLLPHQEMLAGNHLHQYDDDMTDRVIYVSHEWTANDAADPAAYQLRTLQVRLCVQLLASVSVLCVVRCDRLHQIIYIDGNSLADIRFPNIARACNKILSNSVRSSVYGRAKRPCISTGRINS